MIPIYFLFIYYILNISFKPPNINFEEFYI